MKNIISYIASTMALTQWLSWSPEHCLLRSIFPFLGDNISFVLSLALLIFSVFLLKDSNLITQFGEWFSLRFLSSENLLKIRTSTISLVKKALLIMIGLFCAGLIYSFIPIFLYSEDGWGKDTISTAYFLSVLVIILNKIDIPTPVTWTHEEIGVSTWSGVLSTDGLIAYVKSTDGTWHRTGQFAVMIGTEALLLKPLRDFNSLLKISVTSKSIEGLAQISVQIDRQRLPSTFFREDMRVFKELITNDAAYKIYSQKAITNYLVEIEKSVDEILNFDKSNVAGVVEKFKAVLDKLQKINTSNIAGNIKDQINREFSDYFKNLNCFQIEATIIEAKFTSQLDSLYRNMLEMAIKNDTAHLEMQLEIQKLLIQMTPLLANRGIKIEDVLGQANLLNSESIKATDNDIMRLINEARNLNADQEHDVVAYVTRVLKKDGKVVESESQIKKLMDNGVFNN